MDSLATTDTSADAAEGLPQKLPWRLRAYRLLRASLSPLYWGYEKRLQARVISQAVPNHIGLILDGNRRFARGVGLDVCQGHEFGVEKVHELLEWCLSLGIKHVTVFVFSSENFDRPSNEVEYLLRLFVRESTRLVDHPRIKANKVKINVIGQRDKLPEDVVLATETLENSTASHDGMVLNIALAYGGRAEIVDGVKKLLYQADEQGQSAAQVADSLCPSRISDSLYTAGIPDPDFIIRTSGEVRLSGFFLWQAAYSEYYFCEALWPEFRQVDFLRAIRSYQDRERRYGR